MTTHTTVATTLIEALANKFSEKLVSEYRSPNAEALYQRMLETRRNLFWIILFRTAFVFLVTAFLGVYTGLFSRVDALIGTPPLIIFFSIIFFHFTEKIENAGDVSTAIALRWGRIRVQLMQTVEFRQFADDVKEMGLDEAQRHYEERWKHLQQILCDLSRVA